MNDLSVWDSDNVQNEILKIIKHLIEILDNEINVIESDVDEHIFLKLDNISKIHMKLDKIIFEIYNRNFDVSIKEYENEIKRLIITLLFLVDLQNKDKDKNDDLQTSFKKYLKEISVFLIQKNKKYGNAALNPCRIFSKTNKIEQLLVRCDDKLNRIKNRQNDEDEDPIKDLIGYLILILVCVNIDNYEKNL